MTISFISIMSGANVLGHQTKLVFGLAENLSEWPSKSRGSVFIRTAKRNTSYVTQLLGDKAISSESSPEAGQLRDWCIKQGMSVPTVKRVFSSRMAITNLAIAEQGLECRNPFANTFFPDGDNVQSRQPVSIQDKDLRKSFLKRMFEIMPLTGPTLGKHC